MTSVLDTAQRQSAANRRAGRGGLPDRFRIDITDLAEACDFLSRAYGPVRISTPDKITPVQVTGLGAGPLRLGQTDLPMTVDYQAAPDSQVLIGYVVAGVVRWQTEGQAAVFGPGDVAVLKQPGQVYQGRSESACVRTVSFEASVLYQVADGLPDRAPFPVRFTGMTPVSAAAADRLRSTVDFAWNLLAGNPAAGDQPLVTGSTARLLAATALSTFPNTAAAEPTARDYDDASRATLNRAVRFIEENAGADLSAADIAAAAKVSIRAVQFAFRRHLHTTPLAYLRRIRLSHAHHDLVVADPAAQTVTAIAYRWGFPSSSRFAAYYHEAFGMLPSHTLHWTG